MSLHRLVALVATASLVGLLGIAQASNFAPLRKATKTVVESGLRERIRDAHVDGCGG